MACYKKIAQLLLQHFNNGEYPEGKYPSLRKIAADMGCGYTTAVRAMNYLKEMKSDSPASVTFPLVAMITPFWRFSSWHRAVRESVLELGGQLRFINYSSEVDPIITQTINEKYDLVLVGCPVEPGSPLFKVIRKNKDRIIALFQDLTQYGIRSMDGIPEEVILVIMKDLAKYNIRHIDLIGNTGDNPLAVCRKMWHKGLQQINGRGEFYNYPHAAFSEEPEESYYYLKEHFDKRKMPEAFFCMNSGCAQGTYRFLYDLKMVPGKDISVFSFGDIQIATMMTPPLATTVDAGLKKMVKQAISEYAQRKLSSTMIFNLTEQVYYKGDSLVPMQLKDTNTQREKYI